ncbi:HIT domain-containing protein [Rhodoblastus sp. 17X3]|uniref:HIT domain-containing protein n=1 Tax=Rhodoblastus sp. 17X3 TaxID=3047026 RepID=UPI0024B79C42|nr:HIT domain-containing protein [Rhodoblastus sp. 17X3]MDI9847979.1 HIT domain-containing protein [Rhodoblastus sp. 17X3]
MKFALDPRLAADSFLVGELELCRVLLMNDSRFPWLILVPRRAGLSEIHDLSPRERALLIEEAAFAGARLKTLSGAKKINTGALGNMVAQLHMHVVARFEGDFAWPGPVWGAGKVEAYAPEAAEERIDALRAALELDRPA